MRFTIRNIITFVWQYVRRVLYLIKLDNINQRIEDTKKEVEDAKKDAKRIDDEFSDLYEQYKSSDNDSKTDV